MNHILPYAMPLRRQPQNVPIKADNPKEHTIEFKIFGRSSEKDKTLYAVFEVYHLDYPKIGAPSYALMSRSMNDILQDRLSMPYFPQDLESRKKIQEAFNVAKFEIEMVKEFLAISPAEVSKFPLLAQLSIGTPKDQRTVFPPTPDYKQKLLGRKNNPEPQ